MWQPIYERICKDFGYDPAEDTKSAIKLAGLLGDRGKKTLPIVRKSMPSSVLVCGGGDTLADELSAMTIDRYVVVADAAASVVNDTGIDIDMIVTDLDGIVEDQIGLNSNGTVVFIHAHGDNQSALDRYVRSFVGPVVGTCQCPPPPGLFNFGGFTDGDRAACICAELGAKDVLLAGFDFDSPSSKVGRRKDVKKRKLQWAKTIIDMLEYDGVRISYASH